MQKTLSTENLSYADIASGKKRKVSEQSKKLGCRKRFIVDAEEIEINITDTNQPVDERVQQVMQQYQQIFNGCTVDYRDKNFDHSAAIGPRDTLENVFSKCEVENIVQPRINFVSNNFQQQLDELKREVKVLKELNVLNYAIFLRELRLFSKIQILIANGFTVPDRTIVPYNEFLKKLNIQFKQFRQRINGNVSTIEMLNLTLVQIKELFLPNPQEWTELAHPNLSDPKNIPVLRFCVEQNRTILDVKLFNRFFSNPTNPSL